MAGRAGLDKGSCGDRPVPQMLKPTMSSGNWGFIDIRGFNFQSTIPVSARISRKPYC